LKIRKAGEEKVSNLRENTTVRMRVGQDGAGEIESMKV